MRTLLLTFVLLGMMTSHAQIQQDKVLHFAAGSLAGLVGAGVAKKMSNGDRAWTFVGSVAGSLLAGAGKEFIDSGKENNRWDNEDLLATVLGGVTVGITLEIFTKKPGKRRRNLGVAGSYTATYNQNFDLPLEQLSQNGKIPSLALLALSN